MPQHPTPTANPPGLLNRVVTFDRRYWIDPFTLLLHPVAKDFQQHTTSQLRAASERSRQPAPLRDLLVARWSFHLRKAFERDTRFCIFDQDGCWLNPANGRWQTDIKRPPNSTTPPRRLMQELAEALAAVPDSHPDHLLPLDDLLARRLRRHNGGAETPPPPTIPVAEPVTDAVVDFFDEAEHYAPTPSGSFSQGDAAVTPQLGLATLVDAFPGCRVAIESACPNGTSGFWQQPLPDGSRLLLLAQSDRAIERQQLAALLERAASTYQSHDHHRDLPRLISQSRQLRPDLDQRYLHLLVLNWNPQNGQVCLCSAGFPTGCILNERPPSHLRGLGTPPSGACLRVDLQAGDRLVCFNQGLLADLDCDTLWQAYAALLARLPANPADLVAGIVDELRERHRLAVPAPLSLLALGI